MLSSNRIFSAIAKNGVAYGTFAQMNSPEFCEIASKAGLDFVIVDMEHGSFGVDAAVNMIRAVECGGAAPVVRVPDHSRVAILKALDAGAVAVLVPGLETREQAEQIVSATRYAPRGTRGACPCVRGTGHGVHDWNGYVEWASDNVGVMAIIETPAGIANFEEIVSVNGMNAVAIGQFDLSQAMGYGGDHAHPEVRRKQEELARLARKRGVEVISVMFDGAPDYISRETKAWQELGSRINVLSGDRFLLAASIRSMVTAAQARSRELAEA